MIGGVFKGYFTCFITVITRRRLKYLRILKNLKNGPKKLYVISTCFESAENRVFLVCGTLVAPRQLGAQSTPFITRFYVFCGLNGPCKLPCFTYFRAKIDHVNYHVLRIFDMN